MTEWHAKSSTSVYLNAFSRNIFKERAVFQVFSSRVFDSCFMSVLKYDLPLFLLLFVRCSFLFQIHFCSPVQVKLFLNRDILTTHDNQKFRVQIQTKLNKSVYLALQANSIVFPAKQRSCFMKTQISLVYVKLFFKYMPFGIIQAPSCRN